jgi:hypothetical protein
MYSCASGVSDPVPQRGHRRDRNRRRRHGRCRTAPPRRGHPTAWAVSPGPASRDARRPGRKCARHCPPATSRRSDGGRTGIDCRDDAPRALRGEGDEGVRAEGNRAGVRLRKALVDQVVDGGHLGDAGQRGRRGEEVVQEVNAAAARGAGKQRLLCEHPPRPARGADRQLDNRGLPCPGLAREGTALPRARRTARARDRGWRRGARGSGAWRRSPSPRSGRARGAAG